MHRPSTRFQGVAMRRYAAYRHLRFESLDDRRMLATVTVDTQDDIANGNYSVGDVSLREALLLSNNGARDTIKFSAKLAGETLYLYEQLDITNDVVIQGLGASQLTIRGGGGQPIFAITET